MYLSKSLLRDPLCVSSFDDFSKSGFQEIIDDEIVLKNTEKLVFCSGKIYYELYKERSKYNNANLRLIRIEQLFPLDVKQINEIIEKYQAKEIIWVQEEPENMGAWRYILSHLKNLNIKLVSRKPSPAPASGSSKSFADQQKIIIDRIFK